MSSAFIIVVHRSPAVTCSRPCSKEDSDCIYVDNDTRIQIVDTMAFLPRADKEQCGAFIVSAPARAPFRGSHRSP